MEVSGLNGLQYDEEKALTSLLDAFGSVFSLKDIASAYCEAGRNADLAGEILFEMQGSTSSVTTDLSAGKMKYDQTSKSRGNKSQTYYQTNGGFIVPKENWQPLSAAGDASNGELKSDESSESSGGNNSQNYCRADGDFTAPKQECQPVSAASNSSNGEAKNDGPSESFCSNSLQSSWQANGDLRAPKQKRRPISGGTVSSMLGKGYMKSVPLASGSYPGTKPFKVDSEELPMSELWGEGLKSSPLKEERLHKDMEDFLFKMLGEGFRLDKDVIRDVLDSCGYDMQKSMEKLLDRSTVNLDEENKFLGESSKKNNDMHTRAEGPSEKKNSDLSANGGELTRLQKDRNDLQQDVLAAFFKGPERFDELPRRRTRFAKRPIALGELVEGPLIDFPAEQKADGVRYQEVEKDDEDEEDGFQALRRAVKEYRGTMKEYYKAAVDAFAKGDPDQANRFLEQGQFFREKARQADEESNQKIFETRNTNTDDEMQLELHDLGAREAIRHLKSHLSLLAGIPLLKYLKVIVETNEEDSSKGSRRRLVLKLLEKESISWSEGETPGVVMIRMDNINPKRLSFAKK
ncbi:putative nuclear RNA export factor SDE5 isoform X2 [Herrania umbratica]|uniref:Nuclear RNA export factor SDE5 isoform X2 n=1 Tax=Herrania umbratica TaxID=108875 RepID=A0A6J1B5W4_9ROSI|nr:putative nuclear RNA export factor SDE5 isoform X2 [Herrania umbratica]